MINNYDISEVLLFERKRFKDQEVKNMVGLESSMENAASAHHPENTHRHKAGRHYPAK